MYDLSSKKTLQLMTLHATVQGVSSLHNEQYATWQLLTHPGTCPMVGHDIRYQSQGLTKHCQAAKSLFGYQLHQRPTIHMHSIVMPAWL